MRLSHILAMPAMYLMVHYLSLVQAQDMVPGQDVTSTVALDDSFDILAVLPPCGVRFSCQNFWTFYSISNAAPGPMRRLDPPDCLPAQHHPCPMHLRHTRRPQAHVSLRIRLVHSARCHGCGARQSRGVQGRPRPTHARQPGRTGTRGPGVVIAMLAAVGTVGYE